MPNNSPMRLCMIWGVFWELKLFSTAVSVTLYEILCYIGECYNSTTPDLQNVLHTCFFFHFYLCILGLQAIGSHFGSLFRSFWNTHISVNMAPNFLCIYVSYFCLLQQPQQRQGPSQQSDTDSAYSGDVSNADSGRGASESGDHNSSGT